MLAKIAWSFHDIIKNSQQHEVIAIAESFWVQIYQNWQIHTANEQSPYILLHYYYTNCCFRHPSTRDLPDVRIFLLLILDICIFYHCIDTVQIRKQTNESTYIFFLLRNLNKSALIWNVGGNVPRDCLCDEIGWAQVWWAVLIMIMSSDGGPAI